MKNGLAHLLAVQDDLLRQGSPGLRRLPQDLPTAYKPDLKLVCSEPEHRLARAQPCQVRHEGRLGLVGQDQTHWRARLLHLRWSQIL